VKAVVGVHTPKPRVCSLCKSAEPKAGCPQCELTQPSLFSVPMPPLSEEDLAAGEADRRAALAEAEARARRAEQLRSWASLGRPVRVALVGCAKNKRSEAAPARELYLGPLFRAALAYAELSAEEAYVASAFHGLVALDQVIGPYDRSIDDLKKKERLPWGDRVIGALAARFPGLRPELLILAGAGYHVPLHVAAVMRGWTTVSPLAGLPVGKRLRWLKNESAALILARKKRRSRRRAE
jgi:hypothetical protein